MNGGPGGTGDDDRRPKLPTGLHRLHWRRQDDGRPRGGGGARGVRAVDPDRELEQRLGPSIEDYSPPPGGRAFGGAGEALGAEVLEAPPARVISRGGGSIGPSRARELLARHTVV